MAGTASVLKSASPLEAGESGVGDAAGAAAGGAVIQLSGQDLGEVAQVGGVVAGGDLGQPGGLGADGGQHAVRGRRRRSRPRRRCRSRGSCAATGQQLVVGVQGRGRAVIAGQRADLDHRRSLPAGPAAGLDHDHLRIQDAGS